ncbi:MAG: DUF3830 family protein [Planctomycetota bacterium]|jgi:hypothetical protein|nr:DUF3830 family protein [Planctomycetota bacterium]
MKTVTLASGEFAFTARLEEEKSPQSCNWLLELLPWTAEMRHVSWSGNACFAQLGDLAHSVPFENPIRIPSRGEIIVYPGNIPHLQMGGEFFLSWGPCSIAAQNGNLMGNHVLTITEGLDRVEAFGRAVHLGGVRELRVELA